MLGRMTLHQRLRSSVQLPPPQPRDPQKPVYLGAVVAGKAISQPRFFSSVVKKISPHLCPNCLFFPPRQTSPHFTSASKCRIFFERGSRRPQDATFLFDKKNSSEMSHREFCSCELPTSLVLLISLASWRHTPHSSAHITTANGHKQN